MVFFLFSDIKEKSSMIVNLCVTSIYYFTNTISEVSWDEIYYFLE